MGHAGRFPGSRAALTDLRAAERNAFLVSVPTRAERTPSPCVTFPQCVVSHGFCQFESRSAEPTFRGDLPPSSSTLQTGARATTSAPADLPHVAMTLQGTRRAPPEARASSARRVERTSSSARVPGFEINGRARAPRPDRTRPRARFPVETFAGAFAYRASRRSRHRNARAPASGNATRSSRALSRSPAVSRPRLGTHRFVASSSSSSHHPKKPNASSVVRRRGAFFQRGGRREDAVPFPPLFPKRHHRRRRRRAPARAFRVWDFARVVPRAEHRRARRARASAAPLSVVSGSRRRKTGGHGGGPRSVP